MHGDGSPADHHCSVRPCVALPVQVPLRVSLRQLYVGDSFDTVYVRQAMCVGASQCEKNCKDCAGPGIAVKMHQLGPGFVQQVQVWHQGLFFFGHAVSREETNATTVHLGKPPLSAFLVVCVITCNFLYPFRGELEGITVRVAVLTTSCHFSVILVVDRVLLRGTFISYPARSDAG